MMTKTSFTPLDPRSWRAHVAYRLSETAGLARLRTPVDVAFEIPDAVKDGKLPELRVALEVNGAWAEVPAQFYGLASAATDPSSRATSRDSGTSLSGRAAFFMDFGANETKEVRLYYGDPPAGVTGLGRDLPVRGLKVVKGPLGPLHYSLEGEHFRIETMPKSGQIWHIWNKLGSDSSWHHHEWDSNKDKGGDPCHWAPNCWVAYPERVTNGYDAPDPDSFDWHYVFGWDHPDTEIIDGPVFWELRRRGVVWPHPEHSNPNLRRDKSELIAAEVVYRFYHGCPWFYQSSTIRTLRDLLVYFIRNSQFVFLDHLFTHAIICPEAVGVKPTDAVEPAVVPLMARLNVKPFEGVQHSLSNVLPSKLDYTGFYSSETGDGFAQFQLLERNSNQFTGKPTYYNHMTFLTELPQWAVYFCRAFSYTNLRFHPENAVFLPKGEQYEEENVCLIYRHEKLADTLGRLERMKRELQNPVKIEEIHVTPGRVP